jgi:hypothetical protein
MMRRISCVALVLACLLVPAAPLQAGGKPGDVIVLPVEQIVTLAKKVERVAAENGARVFLVARVGRPPEDLPPGIEYTHVSFGVYSAVTTTDGRTIPGYSVYNLYQSDTDPARSILAVDFPADFLAPAHVAKAAVLIPTPELQRRLLNVIASGDWQRVHNPAYSAFANPFDARYQNCTEFVLDVLNAAIYNTTDIAQLKANARAHFSAQRVRINPLKLFFASLFMPDVRLGDQRNGIQTATYQTIADYLQDNGLVDRELTVQL